MICEITTKEMGLFELFTEETPNWWRMFIDFMLRAQYPPEAFQAALKVCEDAEAYEVCAIIRDTIKNYIEQNKQA